MKNGPLARYGQCRFALRGHTCLQRLGCEGIQYRIVGNIFMGSKFRSFRSQSHVFELTKVVANIS